MIGIPFALCLTMSAGQGGTVHGHPFPQHHIHPGTQGTMKAPEIKRLSDYRLGVPPSTPGTPAHWPQAQPPPASRLGPALGSALLGGCCGAILAAWGNSVSSSAVAGALVILV